MYVYFYFLHFNDANLLWALIGGICVIPEFAAIWGLSGSYSALPGQAPAKGEIDVGTVWGLLRATSTVPSKERLPCTCRVPLTVIAET